MLFSQSASNPFNLPPSYCPQHSCDKEIHIISAERYLRDLVKVILVYECFLETHQIDFLVPYYRYVSYIDMWCRRKSNAFLFLLRPQRSGNSLENTAYSRFLRRNVKVVDAKGRSELVRKSCRAYAFELQILYLLEESS
mmetsp:Transcript_48513/g.128331  ORF Transcript_48513/g.128331 Transcript_48513/m.128331 type:complete len:139 (+) Transcript_48513:35-451(+)